MTGDEAGSAWFASSLDHVLPPLALVRTWGALPFEHRSEDISPGLFVIPRKLQTLLTRASREKNAKSNDSPDGSELRSFSENFWFRLG